MASEAAQKVCALAGCDMRFTPTRRTQVFCTAQHGREFHNTSQRRRQGFADRICERDGCQNTYTPDRKNARYCSRACATMAHNASTKVEPTGILDDAELIQQAEERGYRIERPAPPVPVAEADLHRLKGGRFRVGIVSDTHFGSKFQQPSYLIEHLRYMKRQKVSAILVPGDVTDGAVSMHPGFAFETFLHGADAQINYALERWPELGIPHHFIAGNHDASHWKAGGIDVVQRICEGRDEFNYLGPEIEGNFRGSIGYVDFGGVRIQLCHPHLGSTRTRSYRVERWVEELTPESKPNVVAMGNFHKCLTLDYRNVFSLMLPAYQAQSAWMASKGISSYIGGCILEFGEDSRGIAPSVSVEWLIERVPRDHDW